MHKKTTTDILIVGVGGQGIVLASEVLASVAMTAGLDVKQNEVHGMAQRGGSVTSHVRFGNRIYSPTIEKGHADYLLSFEMLEAARWIEYLHKDGVAIMNNQRIDPITVASGTAEYPGNIPLLLRKRYENLMEVDGIAIAQTAGNTRAVNMALLGALSFYLSFDNQLWGDVIRRKVPAKTLEINLTAFRTGRAFAKEMA